MKTEFSRDYFRSTIHSSVDFDTVQGLALQRGSTQDASNPANHSSENLADTQSKQSSALASA